MDKKDGCEELTHWKRPWCWERLKAGGEGDDREWDSWLASLTRWTWVWVRSGSWWWTGKPGLLQSMGSQSRTWLSNWTELCIGRCKSLNSPTNCSFDTPHSYLGPVSCIFTSQVSSGLTLGCREWLQDTKCSFPPRVPSRLAGSTDDDFDILYLLIWQEILLFSRVTRH